MSDSRPEAVKADEKAIHNPSSNTSNAPAKTNDIKVPLAYASCSIGCKDEHTLPKKLSAIAAAALTSKATPRATTSTQKITTPS
jgi:hypothetical protein